MDEAPPRRSLRRTVATAVLVVGAIFIGNFLCTERDRVAPVEIRYVLPAPRPERIDVRMTPEGASEPVATYFQRPTTGEAVNRTRLEPGSYQLDITLTWAKGARSVKRPIEARRDGIVTVDLTGERP